MKQTRLDKMANSMICIGNRAIKESKTWEEEDMTAMFEDDAADYFSISKLIKNGKLGEAARMMNSLDTASRDKIIPYVYDTVMLYYYDKN